MTKDEVLKLALEALEANLGNWAAKTKAVPVIREALAQSEQNEFNPDWDAMAVMVEEQQRMAKRIAELEAQRKPLTDELTDREKLLIQFALYRLSCESRSRMNEAAQDNNRHYDAGAVEAFAEDAKHAEALLGKLRAAHGIKGPTS